MDYIQLNISVDFLMNVNLFILLIHFSVDETIKIMRGKSIMLVGFVVACLYLVNAYHPFTWCLVLESLSTCTVLKTHGQNACLSVYRNVI